MIPLNTVIGTRELCAWQPVRGVAWVQTRVAAHASKLSGRSDCRLVMHGVAGGYLRTYEFVNKSAAWAERLIERYTRAKVPAETATNAQRICLLVPPRSLKTRIDHSDVEPRPELAGAKTHQEAVLA